MRTQTLTFNEVKLQAKKSGKCVICGKRRNRAKTFWQTLNPFNKNADGTVKTRFDINTELQTQANIWQREPINCCELV